MKKSMLSAFAVAGLTFIAASASATTAVSFSFTGTGPNVGSVTGLNPGINVTVSAMAFQNVAPNAFTDIAANSPFSVDLTQTATGLGIFGGASDIQMDTNLVTAREAFVITGSKAFALTELELSYVDTSDTLQIYGVNTNGSLVNFTFGFGDNPLVDAQGRLDGTIQGGANGSLLNLTVNGAFPGTASFGTGLTQLFERYLITTRIGGEVQYQGSGGQGFQLVSLTADPLPEPSSWLLMIVGFGLIGVAARRRKTAVAA